MPENDSSDAPKPARQRIERVPGRRRARLTPVEGSDTSPDVVTHEPPVKDAISGRGPNDDRLLDDVPPHY
ncbi:hypothetical protein [Microbacterium sp.]|uniref:hypothetical protein n=1 Tax=Microbacterium sp. TaxID=51671 RepID=UPI002613A7C4|nr:hypothetical protein [Microbacterium sp.]